MILGAIAGGLIGYKFTRVAEPAVLGALSAGIAGGFSSIKTSTCLTTATKISTSIALTSAILMVASISLLNAYLGTPDPRGGETEPLAAAAVFIEFIIGVITAIIGAISSHCVAGRTDQNFARSRAFV